MRLAQKDVLHVIEKRQDCGHEFLSARGRCGRGAKTRRLCNVPLIKSNFAFISVIEIPCNIIEGKQ